jgi:hypothetical protein
MAIFAHIAGYGEIGRHADLGSGAEGVWISSHPLKKSFSIETF